MRPTVSVFFPLRKGSERVPNKNTKFFAGYQFGLFEAKIKQVLRMKQVDEIIVSTNDEVILELLPKYIKTYNRLSHASMIKRPEELCMNETRAEDLIKYAGGLCACEFILWVHCTSPLVLANHYDLAVTAFFMQRESYGYDSMLSVSKFQNFLLDHNGRVLHVNNKTNLSWPRTQDLDPLFVPNHAMFMARRTLHLEQQRRIGHTPYLHVMDQLSSVDVDTHDDFNTAELLYNKLYGEEGPRVLAKE